jgi:hypothetical protein
MKAWKKWTIIVLVGLVWGGFISWIFLAIGAAIEIPIIQIFFLIGALPYVVMGIVGDHLLGNWISLTVDNTMSAKQERGMSYLLYSPPLYGVLLTYSISKIYEKVRG